MMINPLNFINGESIEIFSSFILICLNAVLYKITQSFNFYICLVYNEGYIKVTLSCILFILLN